MATKDGYSSFKDDPNSNLSNQNDQYSNFNLNANHKCSKIDLIQSKSISSNNSTKNQNYALDQNFDENNAKNNSWNKSAEINSKKLNDLNIFDSKEHEKICLNLKNSSTLSLHISAYENSVADAENGQNSDKNGKNSKQNTSGKNSWKIFKNFALTSKNPFEMSRQQSDQTTEPEMMQFKASQKLFNPNDSIADSQRFSTVGQNKLKILAKLFLDKIEFKIVKLEFEEQFSLQQLIPIIFEKADLPTDNYEVQTVAVLNKQNEKYVTVNDQYLLQSYDKFQVYLVKKEQPHETVAIISAFENEQQKLPIDTSKVTTAKELSQLLSQQMDVKDGNILIQKFDEDFGENLDVNEEDKFDPTKTYNIKVQKILHFDVVVAPNLVADSSSRKFAFKSIGNDEAFKPSVKVEKEIVEPASTAMAPVSSLAVSEVPSPLLSNLEPGLKNSGNNEAIEQSAKTEKEILQPASTVAAPVSPSAVSEAQSPLLPDAEIEKLQVSIDEKSLVTSAEVTSAEEEDSESEVLEVADRDKNQTSFFEENEKMDEDYTQYFDETIKRANQDAVFQPSENMNLEEFVHKSIENTQNETFVNQSVDKSKTLMHSSFEQQPMQNLFSHNLEVEAMNEQVQNDSRSLSEKLKTTINGDLKQMIMNENLWKDPEALQTVIDFIFEKVIQNPEFVEFYSELCLNLYIAEQSTEESNGKTLFLAMIIQKFENIFKQGLTEFLKTITEIQKQVFEERNDLKAQLNEMIQKKRQQMFGIFKFLSILYKIDFFNMNIIVNYISILYHNVETNRNGLMIEFFVELIKNIGPFAAKKKSEDSKIVDNYINDFTYRCQVKREATNEVNFMIAKLLKQKQKWIEKEETFEDAAMKDGCTSADIIALSGYQQDREYQQPAASICGSATRSNYAIPFDANIVHSTPIKVEQHLFADTINKGDATNMDDATLMSESNSENEFDAPAPTLNNTNVEYSNVNHEQPQPKNNRRFYPATSGYREDPAAMVHPDRRVNRLPFDGIAAASSRYSTVNNNAYAPRETSIRPHLNRRATPHNYSNGAAAPSRFPTFPAWNGRENSSSYLMPPENNTRYSPSPSRPATNTPDVHPFRFSSRQERRERTKSFQKNSQPPPAKDSPPKIDPKKVAFKQYFKDLLQSYMNNLNIDEAARSLIENISTYSNPTFCLEGIFEYCCQDLIYNAVQERNAASMLLLKCLQEDSTLKNVFSSAFKNYSNFIVENNIETDDENLILKFPEFFAYIWINDTSKILPTSAFIDGFKPLHENESSLFPRCLSAFGRLANPQGQLKVGERMGMLYHEFVAADSYYKSKQIQKVLEKFLFSYGKYHNLKNLLESMHCFKTYKN